MYVEITMESSLQDAWIFCLLGCSAQDPKFWAALFSSLRVNTHGALVQPADFKNRPQESGLVQISRVGDFVYPALLEPTISRAPGGPICSRVRSLGPSCVPWYYLTFTGPQTVGWKVQLEGIKTGGPESSQSGKQPQKRLQMTAASIRLWRSAGCALDTRRRMESTVTPAGPM